MRKNYGRAGYGSMPEHYLTDKFEETNINESESEYNDYSRGVAKDFGADKPLFEDEHARKNTGSTSRINLKYEGHRGEDPDADYSRGESFYGFIGEEDRENRGTTTDVDMKKLKRQSEARKKYHNFSAENYDGITGGSRSEKQIIQDRQTANKRAKTYMKNFSQSYVQSNGHKSNHNIENKSKVYSGKNEIDADSHTTLFRRILSALGVDIGAKNQTKNSIDQRWGIGDRVASYNTSRKSGNARKNDPAQVTYDQEWQKENDKYIILKRLLQLSARSSRVSDTANDAEFNNSEESTRKWNILIRQIGALAKKLDYDGEFANMDEAAVGSRLHKMFIGKSDTMMMEGVAKSISHNDIFRIISRNNTKADAQIIKNINIDVEDITRLTRAKKSGNTSQPVSLTQTGKMKTEDAERDGDSLYNYSKKNIVIIGDDLVRRKQKQMEVDILLDVIAGKESTKGKHTINTRVKNKFEDTTTNVSAFGENFTFDKTNYKSAHELYNKL